MDPVAKLSCWVNLPFSNECFVSLHLTLSVRTLVLSIYSLYLWFLQRSADMEIEIQAVYRYLLVYRSKKTDRYTVKLTVQIPNTVYIGFYTGIIGIP